MRRAEREVSDPAEIDSIIRSCDVCRVGFFDGGEVYIVPMNFGHVHRNGRRFFYFHGAKEGRKANLAADSPTVAFELDRGYQIQKAETACSFSAGYQCIMGAGRLRVLENPAEKVDALQSIMAQVTGQYDWDFSEKAMETVNVYVLEVTSLTCKEHKL